MINEVKNIENSNFENHTPVPFFNPIIKVKDLRTCRRAMSKVIFEYQKGNITDKQAKTITYLLQNYSMMCKLIDIEKKDEGWTINIDLPESMRERT